MGSSPTHSRSASAAAPEESPAPAIEERKPGASNWRPGHPNRRRRFIVDKRAQLHSVALVGLLTVGLLVPVNLSLHVIRSWTTAEIATDAPQAAFKLDEQNRVERQRVLLGSVILLLAVLALTILRTHKTAGAAFKIRKSIAQLHAGKYGFKSVLRLDDRLPKLEQALNELSCVLLERSNRIVTELEHVASAADRISSPVESHEVGEMLRQMAAKERLNRSS